MEEWSQSLLQALINCIKNPQLYWAFLVSFFVVYFVRNEQRRYFGKALYGRINTWLHTFTFSIVGSLIISAITLTFGLVFTYEIIVILCVITFILTIGYRLTFLSASFILGFTYLLLLPTHLNFFQGEAYYLMISMTLIIGCMLLIEAYHVYKIKPKHLSPEIRISLRGAKIGRFSFEKLLFVPFFVFVPGDTLLPLLPVFSFGDGIYSLALIPFIFGFNYQANHHVPQVITKKIATYTAILGSIVIIGSIVSFIMPVINYGVIAIAIIGQLYIQITAKVEENHHLSTFIGLKNEPKVFWIEKESIAEAADIQIGDTIVAVNQQQVQTIDHLNDVLKRLPPGTREFTIENYLHNIRSVKIVEPVYSSEEFGVRFID